MELWLDLKMRTRVAAVLAVVLMLGAMLTPLSEASPAPHHSSVAENHQAVPDWMPQDLAPLFDIGVDVLVPFSLPTPFSGMPQYSASDGYYSLYWYVGGGTPTLLQVIG